LIILVTEVMWNSNRTDFNNSYSGGGGFSTPQGDEKKQKSAKRSNAIVPVTIAQILTAKHDDDAFVSGNLDLGQVTFVGLVRSVNESATRIDYEITDMTGPPIEVRHFNETDEETGDVTTSIFPANTYVRVNGLIRTFGGKRNINCHKMMKIDDVNEITCHMLEVIHASATSQQTGNDGGGFGSSSGGFGVGGGDDGQIPGLSGVQSQVQAIIKRENSEKGCSVDTICRALTSVAPKAVREAIDFLSTEGLIYSTIDDEHYQATD